MSVRALRRGSIAASRVQAPSTITVLDFSGAASNYVSTPDTAAVSIGGDLDIRCRVAPDDWTPANANTGSAGVSSVFSKFGAQFSWLFGIDSGAATTGTLFFGISTNGSNFPLVRSSVATGFTDGTTHWIRVTRSGSTVTFYTSNDATNDSAAVSWTQLGTTGTLSGTIFDTTVAVEIGLLPAHGTNYGKFTGTVYYAELRSSVGGTVVAKFDPSAVVILGTRNPTTVVASTGETWTVSGSAWDWAAV